MHRRSEVWRCPFLLQPHIMSLSLGMYEPCLQHCQIRCHVHKSIKRVMWWHTHPYYHMQWIILQLLCEIEIFLLPEHRISVTHTAIDGIFVAKKNLCAGYNTWECVQHCTAQVIVPIHIDILQIIHESQVISPHIQVFVHVVLHCWLWHTKLWWSFPCWPHWRMLDGNKLLHNFKCIVFLLLCSLSVTLSSANTHFSQSSSSTLVGGALLNNSWNTAITCLMVWPVNNPSCTFATSHCTVE